MRHLRHFRYIFPGLSAGLIAATMLAGPSLAQERRPYRMVREGYQSEYRPSSAEEEHLSPAVQEVKRVLITSLRDATREQDLKSRKENLSRRVGELRGILDYRQALMLHEWQDKDDLNKDVSDIDRDSREKIVQWLIQAMREALKSGVATRQLAAADFLGEIGVSIRGTAGGAMDTQRGIAAALAPDLAALLPGKNALVSAAAARALGKINPDPTVAIPALERTLQSGQVVEQEAAAGALTDLIRVADQVYKGGKSILTEPLSARQVGDLGERVVQAASPGLRNPDPEVRLKCVETLRQAAVALVELVPFEEARDIAGPQREFGDLMPLAKSLGDRGDSLARLLTDAEASIRLAAARTLEEMANARARLLRVSESMAEPPAEKKGGKEPPAQEALFRGLRATLPAIAQTLGDPDPEVRLAAVEILEMLGSEASSSAGPLTRALSDRNRFVRWAAARTLSNIDPNVDAKAAETAVPALARVLFDPDLHTRLAAAATLEHYGPAAKAAVPQMARAVGVGDAEIRVAVIRDLEALDPADAQPAVPALSMALTHPDERVRRAAAETLGRIGPLARDAEPALRRALDDREDLVRKAAAEALINLNLKK